MPNLFNDLLFTRTKRLYLISVRRYIYPVSITLTKQGKWVLQGATWKDFAYDNITPSVSMLHFIQEGDNNFYVTGYDKYGNEAAGYVIEKHRVCRFMIRVLNNTNVTQVRVIYLNCYTHTMTIANSSFLIVVTTW